MMKLKIATGILASLAMMSTAHAASCPTLTISHSQGAEELTFTSALLKDKNLSTSVVICRYEGKGDLAASSGLRFGRPVKATGSGWVGDSCVVNNGDARKCSFK